MRVLPLALAAWSFRDATRRSPWRAAVVPGCVHRDLLRHRLIPDPFWGTNELDLRWIEERDWEYRAAFTVPQALLDEIYPLAAYYQDSWSEGIAQVRLAGLGDRTEDFREPLERELNCPVGSLLSAASADGRIHADEMPLAERGLDALIGWTLNRGA